MAEPSVTIDRFSFHPNRMDAELMRLELLEAGLHPLPLANFAEAFSAGDEQGLWVFLPRFEVERGRGVLEGTSRARRLWAF